MQHASRLKQFQRGCDALLARLNDLTVEEKCLLLRQAFDHWSAACYEKFGLDLLQIAAFDVAQSQNQPEDQPLELKYGPTATTQTPRDGASQSLAKHYAPTVTTSKDEPSDYPSEHLAFTATTPTAPRDDPVQTLSDQYYEQSDSDLYSDSLADEASDTTADPTPHSRKHKRDEDEPSIAVYSADHVSRANGLSKKTILGTPLGTIIADASNVLQEARKVPESKNTHIAVDPDKLARLADLFVRAFGNEGVQAIRQFLQLKDAWTNGKIKEFQSDLRNAGTHLEQLLVAYRTYHETLVEEPLDNWLKYTSLALFNRKYSQVVAGMHSNPSTKKEIGTAPSDHYRRAVILNDWLFDAVNSRGWACAESMARKEINQDVLGGKIVNMWEKAFGRGLFVLMPVFAVRNVTKGIYRLDEHQAIVEVLARQQLIVSVCQAVKEQVLNPVLDKHGKGVYTVKSLVRGWNGRLEEWVRKTDLNSMLAAPSTNDHGVGLLKEP